MNIMYLKQLIYDLSKLHIEVIVDSYSFLCVDFCPASAKIKFIVIIIILAIV